VSKHSRNKCAFTLHCLVLLHRYLSMCWVLLQVAYACRRAKARIDASGLRRQPYNKVAPFKFRTILLTVSYCIPNQGTPKIGSVTGRLEVENMGRKQRALDMPSGVEPLNQASSPTGSPILQYLSLEIPHNIFARLEATRMLSQPAAHAQL